MTDFFYTWLTYRVPHPVHHNKVREKNLVKRKMLLALIGGVLLGTFLWGTTYVEYPFDEEMRRFNKMPDGSKEDMRIKQKEFRRLLSQKNSEEKAIYWFGEKFKSNRKKYGHMLYDVRIHIHGKEKRVLLLLLGTPDKKFWKGGKEHLLWTWRELNTTVFIL